MRIIRSILTGVLIFGVPFTAWVVMPKPYRYMLIDWYGGLFAPKLTESPDSFSAREQGDLIREYQNRNYTFKCYGNLQHEEKIGPTDDYACNAYISAAFDNVPAKRLTFLFAKGKLSNVRIEFPEKSFTKLHEYLSRKLGDYPRLDQMPGRRLGTDNFGKPLMAWVVKEGVLTTTAESAVGETQILLWSAFDPERLRPLRN